MRDDGGGRSRREAMGEGSAEVSRRDGENDACLAFDIEDVDDVAGVEDPMVAMKRVSFWSWGCRDNGWSNSRHAQRGIGECARQNCAHEMNQHVVTAESDLHANAFDMKPKLNWRAWD